MFWLMIAAAAAAPAPVEYTLSLHQNVPQPEGGGTPSDQWRVRVTLRPGEPQPGKLVELIFDVARQRDGDAGDPQPLSDGKLGLTLTGPGRRVRLLVHPLGDAGVYGAHWTPSAKGLWTLALAPWRDAGPTVSFQVGAGAPMPASSQGHAVLASRTVVAPGKSVEPPPPTVKQLKAELGSRWLEQSESKPDPAEPLARPALAAEPLLSGDAKNGRGLYRLHCAACHGETGEPTAVGRSLHAPLLRDPALIAGRSDDQLVSLLLEGTPSHPAPGTALTLLDAADLVAFLRSDLPAIHQLFPDAAVYTAKTYTLPAPSINRAESLAGDELRPDERALTVFSVYSGDQPATGPRLVPQDPVQLDELSPQTKKGYVVFGSLAGRPVAMAMGLDFTVLRLVSGAPEIARVAPAVVGKGGKEPAGRKPFVSKAAPDAAKALTRLYARAVEAAAMAGREEADRHLFDSPEASKRDSP
ncbi:MAG TPA: c-type cytochrome [Myxococcales bacterium]